MEVLQEMDSDDADEVALRVRAGDRDHEGDLVASLRVREAVVVRDELSEMLGLRLAVYEKERVRLQLPVGVTDRVGVRVGEGVSTSVCEMLALVVRLAVRVQVCDLDPVAVGAIVGEPVSVAERVKVWRDSEGLEQEKVPVAEAEKDTVPDIVRDPGLGVGLGWDAVWVLAAEVLRVELRVRERVKLHVCVAVQVSEREEDGETEPLGGV